MQQSTTGSSEPYTSVAKGPEDEETGLLDELLEGESGTETSMFGDSENAFETSDILVDVIADVKAENKEKKDAEAVYESVSTALRELQGLMIDNDTAKLGSIRNKLEQIISCSNRLLEELKSIDN